LVSAVAGLAEEATPFLFSSVAALPDAGSFVGLAAGPDEGAGFGLAVVEEGFGKPTCS
jgi:hypothetical protein